MPQFTFTVPNNKLADFKTGILKHAPVPVDSNDQPTMSENAWIKRLIIENIKSMYRAGKEELFNEQNQPTVDENIVT